MKLYQELLLDHYKNPRHYGSLSNATFSTGEQNPSCGDIIALQGIVRDGVLVDAVFQGKGCVISQAAASLLLEQAIGKKIAEILTLGPDDMRALLKIEIGPVRLKCATLALLALHEGLHSYNLTHKTGEK